jgi:hypothetical protein
MENARRRYAKAKIINFEAAKGNLYEQTFSQLPTEAGQSPQGEKRDEFSAPEGETRGIQYPAEIKNNVIDFNAAREKRLIGGLYRASREMEVVREGLELSTQGTPMCFLG